MGVPMALSCDSLENSTENAEKYAAGEVEVIKGRIKRVVKKFGVEISED